MRYTGTLLAVTDMDTSKRFYHDVLGLDAVADFGANVTLDGGVVLQTMETWKSFLHTDEVTLQNNAGELYFEEGDMDAFCQHLERFAIHYVHRLHEHPWGQRVVRFYDPDRHIIEVAEELDAVILRFVAQGLSAEETAARMGVPLDFVTASLDRSRGQGR